MRLLREWKGRVYKRYEGRVTRYDSERLAESGVLKKIATKAQGHEGFTKNAACVRAGL